MSSRPYRSLSTGEKAALFIGNMRRAIPFLATVFGFLLTTIPFFPPLAVIPNFGLLLLFLFALYRPSQLAAWSAVPLGLIADLFLNMPLGANALLMPLFMLAIYYVDTLTRRVHWFADWLMSVPFILGYQFALWILCRFGGPDAPLLPFLTQGAATIAAFPLIAFLFVSIQRRFVDRLTK